MINQNKVKVDSYMKKETILFVVFALAVGILIGVIVTNAKKDSSSPKSTSTTTSIPIAAPVVNQQQQNTILEEVVAREPDNRNAWVRLGHNYFDSDQPVKAIDAYARALEIDDNDPNVLTDQGIMFRRVGWFDKAIVNFEKASSIDTRHQQSLYNLGIVYRYDLKKFAPAIVAWERFIAINPIGPGADKVRSELKYLKQQPNFPEQPQSN